MPLKISKYLLALLGGDLRFPHRLRQSLHFRHNGWSLRRRVRLWIRQGVAARAFGGKQQRDRFDCSACLRLRSRCAKSNRGDGREYNVTASRSHQNGFRSLQVFTHI
jgi:hypothetical protein